MSKATKFTLEITLGNDAMRNPRDVADALCLLANRIRADMRRPTSGEIRDLNGNKVGTWSAEWPS